MEKFLTTFTGKTVRYNNFTPDMVAIEDVAHALSNVCRFGGHIPRHYSVAEHSLLAAELAPDEHKLAVLLHDASEAYLSDIVSPAKAYLFDYKSMENRIQSAIEEKFGIDIGHKEVEIADLKALYIEARSFYGDDEIKKWGFRKDIIEWGENSRKDVRSYAPAPWKVKALFINTFLAYGGER